VKNIELEAKSLCELAKIYFKILKLEDKAKRMALKCLKMVDLLKPMDCSKKAWYLDAMKIK
jgi:hypothetical protein